MKKFILAAALMSCCLMISGCFYYPFQGQSFSLQNDTPDAVPSSPDGQKCPSGMVVLNEGEEIKTNILDLEINSAGLYQTYEGESPEDDEWRFLVVNITSKSRFESSACLYIQSDQFLLTWDDLDGYVVTPEEDAYIADQLPNYENKIRFFKNSSRTGNLVFVVPKNISGLKLIYQKSALPFTANAKEDPYGEYYSDGGSDYYSGKDNYYNTPYYGSPDFDWFDFFGGFGDDSDSGLGGNDDSGNSSGENPPSDPSHL